MSQKLRKFFKAFGALLLLFLLYALGIILYGTYTDYQPTGVAPLQVQQQGTAPLPADSTLSLLSWNLGYCGLGAKCNFFYNGGGFFLAGDKMVRPPEELVQENYQGVRKLIQNNPSDIYLLQEVDMASKRSYFLNQYEGVKELLGGFVSSFAPNFKVDRVPIPILEPWRAYGQAHSGLATYSRYTPNKVERHQLPGEHGWPDRIFQLDRCAAVHYLPVDNGKQLVLLNIHNSAYDKNGVLKKQQMNYLKDFLLAEYEKGNYVIAGGDWNQCPPFFKFDAFRPGGRPYQAHYNIDAEFMPSDWQWIYDPTLPTSRSTKEFFDPKSTFITLIDYFLISPNINALKVKTINQDFRFSDHQAVRMEVRLGG
ncbi:MAG: endonuclease/exonuclease/phosphatase family protein [Bacteroidota bacterium]